MSSGAELTNAVRDRMRADGVDFDESVPVNDPGGSPAQGTGGEPMSTSEPTTPSAETSNTEGQVTNGPPDTIPYSRFTEVNSRLQDLRPWEDVAQMYANMGIEPDSAVRLANFEQAYIQDPVGTLSAMVDQQDLPDAQKTALKALLKSEQDAALKDDQKPEGDTPKLPDEVMEAVNWVREQRQERESADVQSRLEHTVRHWQQQDEQDGVQGVTERQRLLYIQSAAGSGTTYSTLEELADAARTNFLEDRDSNLGSAVSQRRASVGPLAVPSGGLPPTPPVVPKNMKEARAMIEADIAAGRFPDLQAEG